MINQNGASSRRALSLALCAHNITLE